MKLVGYGSGRQRLDRSGGEYPCQNVRKRILPHKNTKVEATLPAAMELADVEDDAESVVSATSDATTHLDRMTEVLRQSRTLQLPACNWMRCTG